MALPTVRDKGANCNGLGDVAVTPPTTYAAGDSFWMLAACDTDTITAPTGWTKWGTAFLTGIALSIFSRDTYAAASSGEPSATITDPGNHLMAVMFSVNGGDRTPHFVSGCSTAGSSTTGRCPSLITGMDDILMIFGLATANDTTTGTAFSVPVANADVGSLTEVFDETYDGGNGSGITFASATKAAAGSIRQQEFTVTAGNTVGLAIAIKPKPLVAHPGVAKLDSGGFAADGTTVKLVDTTQPDIVFTATVAGGSGAYSALVRYDDHTYVAFADNGSKRGCSAEAVP